MTPGMEERLRGPLEEALDRSARARGEVGRRGGGAPRDGDVFIFPETPEPHVAWAVVEHQEAAGRFLLVAADSYLLVGSRDVAARPESAGGVSSLRCGVALRLGAEAFGNATRIGALEPELLADVRRRRAEIEAGNPTGNVLEQETDGDPEYEDWIAELELARTVLLGQDGPPPAVGRLVELRRPRLDRFVVPMRLAASILLVVSAALAAALVWQRSRIGGLEERLAAAGHSETLLNVPFALLRPRAARGEATLLEVPPEADLVHLILAVEDPEAYSEYSLDVARSGSGTPIRTYGGLETTGVAEISLALPATLLGAGEYELRLFGRRAAGAVLLGEYELEVVPAR